ncbi:hypothetical protein DENSPDRAFT_851699 [Dentipellis sp. KUC8613]|nr:hypothetical protein DENSPDRAFT_851699 [Dentipellis sp. KUC8613]
MHQPDSLPHRQDNMLMEFYDIISQGMTSGPYQSQSQPQTSGDPRGGYTFANVDPYSNFSLHEPLSLAFRPHEDVHLQPPQELLSITNGHPDVYAQRTGPHDCQSVRHQQQHAHAPHAPYAPPALNQWGMLLPPQGNPETMSYGAAPSPSVPRAYWVPGSDTRYAPPPPPPAATVPPAGGYNMYPSFEASHLGSFSEAPPPLPVPQYPMTTPLISQQQDQAYPMPAYGGLDTGYDHVNKENMDPYFQPGLQMVPGWTHTRLRETSQ